MDRKAEDASEIDALDMRRRDPPREFRREYLSPIRPTRAVQQFGRCLW